jgi:hypothetical protein
MTAASGGYYNDRTGHSGIGTFTIPKNVKSLYLYPSASGLQFGLSTATGTTAFMTAGNGAPLTAPVVPGGPNPVNGPFQVIGGNLSNVVVGVWNAVGGFISVRVFAAPTS